MLRQTVDTFGQIDILVNNAGGMLYPPPNHTAATAPPDHYRYIVDINLTGTVFCCQAAAPYMQMARSGKIVNVASQAGLWSGRNGGGMAYKVAKAGVIHYTRVLAAELGPNNIHVNCIAPGYVLSSRAVAQGRNSPEVREQLLQDIPLGRAGHAGRLRQGCRIPGHGSLRLRHRPVHPRLRRVRRFLSRGCPHGPFAAPLSRPQLGQCLGKRIIWGSGEWLVNTNHASSHAALSTGVLKT